MVAGHFKGAYKITRHPLNPLLYVLYLNCKVEIFISYYTLLRHINAMQSAMEYVFGSTFVCKTIDAAREVCPLIRCFLASF